VERRQYLQLIRQKSTDFWTDRVAAEQSQPCRLWRTFDQLLVRGTAPPASDLDATQLHRYFSNKVTAVRAAADGADHSRLHLHAAVRRVCFARVYAGGAT